MIRLPVLPGHLRYGQRTEETMDTKLPEGRRVAGARQVVRAIRAGKAFEVFLAGDADTRIRQSVLDAAKASGVPVRDISTVHLLGRLMKLSVPAAAGAILREGNENTTIYPQGL